MMVIASQGYVYALANVACPARKQSVFLLRLETAGEPGLGL